MAIITRRACTNGAIFLLPFLFCLLADIVSCKATGGANAPTAPAPANADADTEVIAEDLSDPTRKIFNVLEFGAVLGDNEDPDMIDINHMAFVKAFQAACNHEGKAKLLIPEGTFLLGPVNFMGPCKNEGPLIVEIQATIKASTDISLFPGQGQEWFNFQNINGLIVTGSGTFDGQGESSWKYIKPNSDNNAPGQRLPANIQLLDVANAVVKGINSVNSKGHHYYISNSKNITLNQVNNTTPEESPNTDDIEISESEVLNIPKQ